MEKEGSLAFDGFLSFHCKTRADSKRVVRTTKYCQFNAAFLYLSVCLVCVCVRWLPSNFVHAGLHVSVRVKYHVGASGEVARTHRNDGQHIYIAFVLRWVVEMLTSDSLRRDSQGSDR